MHLATTASAFLLFASAAIAQPVVPSNTSQVVVPARHQGLFSNFGSSWNKRDIRRPSGKRLIHDAEKEKRYWKVSSVSVEDEEEDRASAVHRMTTTITVTVDAIETEYVAPTSTDVVPPIVTAVMGTPLIAIPEISAVPASSVLNETSSISVASVPSTTSSVSLGPVATERPNGKLVFAHFMVGIVSTYAIKDWEFDMTLAKSYGIDGFALNIGKDPYTDAQLALAYQAAQGLGFKVFISFDFNWFSINDIQPVADLINKYVPHPSQFLLPGTNSAYISTFAGDGFDWTAVRSQTGKDIYVVPNWQPSEDNAANSGVQGLFSWYAWPSENNRPVNKAMSTEADEKYMNAVAGEEKVYMAPVSPWFSTHFGKEVPYSKNWIFLSETLWYDRWQQILQMQEKLQYVEIVTWNDYGESHHVGPYDTPHTDDGSSKWAKDMPHDAMLEFAKPYIAAFKAGSPTPIIERDMLVYWHRPTLKNVECDATDNCGSKPEGWEMLHDEIFVAAFTRSPGKVQVASGSNTVFSQDVPAGVTMIRVPMAPGEQDFHFTTSSGTDVQGRSPQAVRASCINGIYNYNFVSGLLSPPLK